MPECSWIKDGIFIGNAYSVVGNPMTHERDLLDELEIDIIISALTEQEYDDYMITRDSFPGREWHRLVIDDAPNEYITQYFNKVHRIIEAAPNKNIIIHCAAGMSRSPTLVIAHVMIANHWGYEEAFDFVKSHRELTRPNISFIKQLKELENKIFNKN
jgi:protein-tyrosine phosphatase